MLLRRSGKQVDPAPGQTSTVHGEGVRTYTRPGISIYLKGPGELGFFRAGLAWAPGF